MVGGHAPLYHIFRARACAPARSAGFKISFSTLRFRVHSWRFPFRHDGVPPVIIQLSKDGMFMMFPFTKTLQRTWGSPYLWKPPFMYKLASTKWCLVVNWPECSHHDNTASASIFATPKNPFPKLWSFHFSQGAAVTSWHFPYQSVDHDLPECIRV